MISSLFFTLNLYQVSGIDTVNVLLGEWAPFYLKVDPSPDNPGGHGGFCWDLLQEAKAEMESKRNTGRLFQIRHHSIEKFSHNKKDTLYNNRICHHNRPQYTNLGRFKKRNGKQ